MKKRRVLAALMCVVMLISLGSFPAGAADSGEKRLINVVYDDSGSMYGADNNTWSQALYAMEIFATMMGSEDEMNIYLMSDEGKAPISVKGSDSDRIHTIENGVAGNGNTPFQTVRSAASDLLSASAEYERWLVVLTDGAFKGVTNVESELSDYAKENVNVVYLAIGSDANTLNGDTSIGYYAYHAKSSTDILGCITSIANQIFKQQILPANHMTIDGDTITMDIDIPVTQILIFAQGEGISAGTLSLNGQELTATSKNQVAIGDGNIPDYYSGRGYKAAAGLSGIVHTYYAGDTPYEKGTYSVTVSDTENVEIYYIPGVDIDCVLIDEDGTEVTSGETHYAGIYDLDTRFVDRTTGEKLQSDLLDGAQFSAVLTNGGRTIEIDSSTDSIQLTEGDAVLTANAILPGNVNVSSQHTYTVAPEPIRLDLAITVPGSGYKLSALGKKAEAITVKVTERSTGETIDKDMWKAMGADGLKVTSAVDNGQVNWLVTQGSDTGTWEIRPDYITDISDTGYGSAELTFSIDYTADGQSAWGAGSATTYIAGYTTSELKIEIVVPSVSSEDGSEDSKEANIHLSSVSDSTGVMVKISAKDEYSGEFVPLTAEQFAALKVSFACADEFSDNDSALKWKLAATSETGVFELKLDMLDAEKVAYSMRHIDTVVDVVVAAAGELQDDMYIYEGTGSGTLTVHTMGLGAIFSRIGAYVIGGAALLFVLLGFLFKKRLKYKKMKPYDLDLNTDKRIYVVKKRVWATFLLPWLSQRATIMCNVPKLNCKFPTMHIKAAGGGKFYVTNIASYAKENITVNNVEIKAGDKKKAYSHIRLDYLDGMGNPRGEFYI